MARVFLEQPTNGDAVDDELAGSTEVGQHQRPHGPSAKLVRNLPRGRPDSTLVSKTGSIAVKFFTRVGIRLSLIPVPKKTHRRRDLLATEFTYGRLFGISSSGINTFGVGVESDLTKNISVRFAINYIPVTEVSVTSTNAVKVGGLAYEASFLRLNYKP